MTYLYYKSTTSTTEPKISEKTIAEWKHLATKKNWRITQLPNGFYQTEDKFSKMRIRKNFLFLIAQKLIQKNN